MTPFPAFYSALFSVLLAISKQLNAALEILSSSLCAWHTSHTQPSSQETSAALLTGAKGTRLLLKLTTGIKASEIFPIGSTDTRPQIYRFLHQFSMKLNQQTPPQSSRQCHLNWPQQRPPPAEGLLI